MNTKTKIVDEIRIAELGKSLATWEKKNKVKLECSFEVLTNGDYRPCFVAFKND